MTDTIIQPHVPIVDASPSFCNACSLRWPCPTEEDRAELAALRARLAEAEAREQALREALLAYGAHLPLCNRRLYPGQGYLCQCGWDAARLLGFAAAQPAARPDAGGERES